MWGPCRTSMVAMALPTVSGMLDPVGPCHHYVKVPMRWGLPGHTGKYSAGKIPL